MDERSDQIVEHIESQRQNLGRNLDELQNRIKSTADWRAQVDKHPMAALGIAMGGGLLLGAMISGGKRSQWRSSSDLSAGSSYSSSPYSSSSSYGASSYKSPSSSVGSESSSSSLMSASSSPGVSHQRSKAMETIENIKGALFGWGAAQAKEWLNQMLPGFTEHFEETSQRNRSHFSSQGSYGQGSPSYTGSSYGGSSSGQSSSPAFGGSQGSTGGSSYGSGSSSTGSSFERHAESGSSKPEPTPAL